MLLLGITIIVMVFLSCNNSQLKSNPQADEDRVRQRITDYFTCFNNKDIDGAKKIAAKSQRVEIEESKTSFFDGWDVSLVEIHSVKRISPTCFVVVATSVVKIPPSKHPDPMSSFPQNGWVEQLKRKYEVIFEDSDWHIGKSFEFFDEKILSGEQELNFQEIGRLGHGDKEVLGVLKKVIETYKDDMSRSAALFALKDLNLPVKDILPILIRVIKEDSDYSCKAVAVQILLSSGDKFSIPLLITCRSNGKLWWTVERQTSKVGDIYGEGWWQYNKDYFYWDKENETFKIDEQARESKIAIDTTTRKPLTEQELKQQREWDRK